MVDTLKNIVSGSAISVGDRSPLTLLIISLLVAAAGICLIVIVKKKRDSDK